MRTELPKIVDELRLASKSNDRTIYRWMRTNGLMSCRIDDVTLASLADRIDAAIPRMNVDRFSRWEEANQCWWTEIPESRRFYKQEYLDFACVILKWLFAKRSDKQAKGEEK